MQPNRRLALLAIIPILLPLSSCGDDPIGPDNRLALRAFGLCRHAQALQLTDNAVERGSARNAQQALMLKAAILRDQGENAAAEALYPRIAEHWEAVKRRALTPEQREREIAVLVEVAHNERIAQGVSPNCDDEPSQPAKP